jgi:hypothetical protein
VILIRDGEIIDTYTEEKLKARTFFGSLRAMFGVGRDVTVLRVDLRPFNVEMSFGEHPPDNRRYALPESSSPVLMHNAGHRRNLCPAEQSCSSLSF